MKTKSGFEPATFAIDSALIAGFHTRRARLQNPLIHIITKSV